MIDYPGPDPSLLSGTIAIATATLAFLVYIFTIGSERFGRGIRRNYSDRAADVRRILFQRVLGAVVY